MAFSEKFTINEDPEKVVISFKESRITDMSAIDAVNNITKKYREAGKTVRLQHLSFDCIKLLDNADAVIDINIVQDPEYLVAIEEIKRAKK